MRRSLAALLVLALAPTSCAGGKKPAPAEPPSAAPSPPLSPPPEAPVPSPPAPPPTGAETGSITGTVTYRQRIALTPEAVVQVELRDVTRADVEAALIARQVINRPGQVPIAFSLPYARASIEPGRVYAVSARITDRGQLQFVTDTRIPVISNGTIDAIEIVVAPVK